MSGSQRCEPLFLHFGEKPRSLSHQPVANVEKQNQNIACEGDLICQSLVHLEQLCDALGFFYRFHYIRFSLAFVDTET